MNNWNTKPDCWEKSMTHDARKMMSVAMLDAMYRDRSFSMVRTITGHALIPPIKMKWMPAVRLVVDNALRAPGASREWEEFVRQVAEVDEKEPQP